MGLVTALEVKQLIDNTTISDAIVESIIDDADALLAKVFAEDTELGSTLLVSIEKWLAAHMLALTPFARTTTEEQLGEADFKYTGKFGEGLSSTPYGQMALSLDFTGKLKSVGKAQATIFAITTEYNKNGNW